MTELRRWPSEREQFEEENQRMLEDYDAEEVTVTDAGHLERAP